MNDEQKARVIANCEIVIKALREGKKLQWRELTDSTCSVWHEENYYPAVHPSYEYRLKPEPRTIWVNEYSYSSHTGHDTEAIARHCASLANRTAVEYREVVK